MFSKAISALVLIAALAGSAAAKDSEPEVLKRSGKWVVEYDRDACHIYAEFGTGDANVVARITRYSPGDWFKFAVFGQRVRTSNVVEDVRIDFGLRGGPSTEKVLTGTAGKIPALFFNSVHLDDWATKVSGQEAPRVTPENEAAVTGVTIAMRGKRPFRLEAGSFGKPFQVMRHCMSNLVKSWGYDAEVQERLIHGPVPLSSPSRWITDRDYPGAALQMGQSGIVQFRLDVDSEGKVTGCFILDRTEPDQFAAASCRALRGRAKFNPALDATGKPIGSYFVSSVRYIMGN